jgi:hypothetical protein
MAARKAAPAATGEIMGENLVGVLAVPLRLGNDYLMRFLSQQISTKLFLSQQISTKFLSQQISILMFLSRQEPVKPRQEATPAVNGHSKVENLVGVPALPTCRIALRWIGDASETSGYTPSCLPIKAAQQTCEQMFCTS